jgi:uncharacterized membrane protein
MNSSVLSTLGRILFGTAFSGFGLVCLGYSDFVNALEPVPTGLPGYRVVALINGALLLLVGLAILTNQRVNLASRVVIALLVSWMVLLHVPSAFLEPRLLRSPWWLRMFECTALASGALMLLVRTQAPRMDGWFRVGRIGFGIALPVFGVLHLVYPESTAALIPPCVPLPLFLAYFTGLAMITSGQAIVTGVPARLAAMLAGVMYAVFAITLHIPRVWCRIYPCESLPNLDGMAGVRAALTSTFVAIGMAGAAWIVAGSIVDDAPDP